MNDISLFEHNEIAYRNLCDALEKGNCATINHATGTGKSFIALKYLYANRDKKFLYLAPTYQILDQLIDSAPQIGIDKSDLNVDMLIYRNLLDMNMRDLFEKYDGIFFDEYHRCGAKETFFKIKELKRLLVESKSNKKFIGLTATPIRYLDNERNMTDEIFDGVVASQLTLANAMCDGLLPVPEYYISGGAVLAEFDRARRRIEELPESDIKDKLLNELYKLGIDSKFTNEANSALFSKYMNQKEGKYIIFCKDIDTTKLLSKHLDVWFREMDNPNVYMVNSAQSQEEAKKNLDSFNDQKEGLNILLCVDILNEGVHVDGIDGVILYRRTTSPIIYFQQIGRALSFSGRKRNIKVFDLVNNYNNHEAIYDVYDEFLSEIKKRIENDKENESKYKMLLSRFKILDESQATIAKIEKVVSKIDEKAIIIAKIDEVIRYIAKFKKENLIEGDLFPERECDEGIENAYLLLEKYYKYVTNAQFQKLTKLQFGMPGELIMTTEERKAYLGECDSIYEYERQESINSISLVVDFIKRNKRLPKEDADDLVEKNLYEVYINCISRLDTAQLNMLRDTVSSIEFELSPWEKILLNFRPENEEVTELLTECIDMVKANESLPRHYYKAIHQLVMRYNINKEEQILKLLKASDRIEQLNKKNKNEEQQKLVEQAEEIIEGKRYEEKNLTFEEIVEKLDNAHLRVLKARYNKYKKDFIRSTFKRNNTTAISEFCKNIKKLNVLEYPSLIEKLEEDDKMYETTRKLSAFMKEHDDRFPSANIPEEKELRDEVEEAIKKGFFNKSILKFGLHEMKKSGSVRTHEMLEEIVSDDGVKAKCKLFIARQAYFIKENFRRPLEESPDEEESKIARDYNSYVIENLSDSICLSLSNSFNTINVIKNTLEKKKEFMDQKERD